MMTTKTFMDYLVTLFPSDSSIIYNGYVNKDADKSIGVFQGPESRSGSLTYLCGIEGIVVKKLPVNILVVWTDNTNIAAIAANAIYDALVDKTNFSIGDQRVANLILLDEIPISLGRNDRNMCEYTIRVDVLYYV